MHSLSFGSVEIIEEGAVVFDQETGVITEVFRGSFGKRAVGPFFSFSVSYTWCTFTEDFMRSKSGRAININDQRGKIIMPGFIDAHCHAPQ